MDSALRNKYLEFLKPFVSDHKKERITEVLAHRTRFITVVLEDIYQSQNASAVIRTCECMGVQDIHIVENRNSFRLNRDVVRGSAKWINLYRYQNKEKSIRECFDALQSKGYKLIGMSPGETNPGVTDFVPSEKIALVFGTELEGLSAYAQKNVHSMLRIPMFGFTESFNLSVSAALTLQHLLLKIRKSEMNWKLSRDEVEDLKAEWYRKSIRNGTKLEEEFLRLYNK